MKHWISVAGMLLILGFVLAWGVPLAQAAPTSSSQNPAQLSTAAVVFVKVDPKTGTDTILLLNRQQVEGANEAQIETPGTAIVYHLIFFNSDCSEGPDNIITLTPQQVKAALASKLFGVSKPGVVLVEPQDLTTPASASPFVALSALVIDLDSIALYEHIGSPLLQPNPGNGPAGHPVPVWGGFSDQDIDDWFVHSGAIGLFTTVQMICPEGSASEALETHMDFLAAPGDLTPFADRWSQVNVYFPDETVVRSLPPQPCFCNTDSHFFGDFAAVLAAMTVTGVGTFHWNDPQDAEGQHSQAIAWRVISGSGIWWGPTPLRRTPGSATAGGVEIE